MEKIKFKIDHIDPLGQGVSKREEQVAFIEKTLPGEEGVVKAIKSKKKGRLIFSRLDSTPLLSKESPDRVEPDCPHFNECSGCHFLHTSYENEIKFKEITTERLFSNFSQLKAKPQVICATKRFGYRNRIQLHYDNESEELGFVDPLNHKIVKVQECKVANENVATKLKELYQNKSWKSITKNQPKKGHIEIYEIDKEIKVHVNEHYAKGGFSQVNEDMNQKLKNHLHGQVRANINSSTYLLDLFGGGGNLSKELTEYEILVVDGFPPDSPEFKDHQTFEKINMYSRDAIQKLSKKVDDRKDIAIILDPPRSGMKNLYELLEAIRPSYLFMINCEVSSAIRDLKGLKCDFEIVDVSIFDLFPGTRHFETYTTIRLY
jgi:23S rRNA (uracil1939-C5)-methyltransferase